MSCKKKHCICLSFTVCAQEGSKEEDTHILTIFSCLVYRFVNAIQIHEELRRVCDVKRKHDKLSIKEKFVSCSNPKLFGVLLRENLEIEVDISYDDLLCFSSILFTIHMFTEIFSPE